MTDVPNGQRDIARRCRVFVSYAHESESFKQQVIQLCALLDEYGIDSDVDQLAASHQDWPVWATRKIDEADFVLVMASPAYKEVADGNAPWDFHRGARFEAGLLRDRVSGDPTWHHKILAVLLPGYSREHIPDFLMPNTWTWYQVTEFGRDGIGELLGTLTGGAARDGRSLPAPRRGSSRFARADGLVAGALEDLAKEVARQWAQEEERRAVHDPRPLAVRWEATSVARDSAGEAAAVAAESLAGQFGEISAVFGRVPSRRLLIVGGSGTGKSVLAIRLVRDLLSTRQPGDPVPVLFTLNSWDPGRQRLPDWMIAQMVRDHPGLQARITFATGRKENMAVALVEEGWILPVLDGMDQVSPGLRAEAIAAINRLGSEVPLVVTCGDAEYRRAAEELGRGLSRIAAIELRPLDPAEVGAYLAEDAVDAGRWQRVRAELRDHRGGPLSRALRTPLMAWLMRTAYMDPVTKPDELCELARFPDHAAIEEHLLGHLVPAVYPDYPVAGQKARWSCRDAGEYLAFLAGHVNTVGTADIAWWQLEQATPWVYLGCRIAVGILFGFAAGFPEGIVPALSSGVILGAAAASNRLIALLRVQDNTRSPYAFRFVPREYGRFSMTIVMFIVGAFALFVAIAGIDITKRYTERALLAIIILFLLGTALIPWAVIRYRRFTFQTFVPIDLARAVSPAATLRADRTTALAGPWPFLTLGVLGAFFFNEWPLFPVAVASTIGWPLACPYTRFAMARLVLALRGRLPWRTMRFLSEAHERGILRQTGAVYQFRHDRITDAIVGSGALQA